MVFPMLLLESLDEFALWLEFQITKDLLHACSACQSHSLRKTEYVRAAFGYLLYYHLFMALVGLVSTLEANRVGLLKLLLSLVWCCIDDPSCEW